MTGCALALKNAPNSTSGNPQWYFGAPLFEQYCVIFDYTEKRLGFASAKSANKTTVRPATKTTFRPTTRRKLAPIVCNSGILVLMLILANST